MDRISHRAAVEAGYASLAEYIKKWGDDKMELLQRLRDPFKVTPQDAAEAADEIERLREEVAEWKQAANAEASERRKSHDEIERLREALQFYANKKIYIGSFVDAEINWDKGFKARSALKQKESK